MTSPFDGPRSAGYETRIRRMVPGYELQLRLMETCLAAELKSAASVLMVGAGTGAEVLECGLRHPDWRLSAVEPSADMSAIGRAHLEKNGLASRVAWHVGELATLVASDPFDAATLLLVFHFLPDETEKLALLEEIAGRLKPGAPFILTAYVGDPAATRTKKLFDLTKAWAVASGMTPDEAAEKLSPSRPDMHMISEDELKGLLRQAGFIDVQRIFQGFLIGGWLARTQR